MATVFITGGHSGIGLACARQLAARRCDLVLAGRSPDRMRAVADELRAAHGVAVTTLALDIASLASVRRAAAECAALIARGEISQLQAVLCNAGGRFDGEERYSPDGYELTFATNCLGHFLLVELLLPTMAADSRVVFTVSSTHNPDVIDGRLIGAVVEPDATALAGDGKDGAKPLSAGKRYATAKLCTVMYAYELARRLARAGSAIASIAFDPGSVPETNFLRGMPTVVQRVSRSAAMGWAFRRMGVPTSTVAFSGAALAEVAGDPRHAAGSGGYFQAREGILSQVRSSRVSYDEARALALWDDSKRLVRLLPEEESEQLR